MSRTKLGLAVAGLLVLIMAFSLPGQAAAAPPPEGKALRLIIQVKPGADIGKLVKDYGGRLRHSFPGSMVSVSLSEDKFDRLRGDFRVKSVRLAARVEATQDILDWGVDRIDAEKVWGGVEDATDVAGGRNAGDGIKVAIIDTGIDYNHPDLAANYQGGYDFVNDDADPMDDNGHGTHVAGIVAASDNNSGVIGVAPEAYLYAVKVLDSSGRGWEDDVAAGIQWCIDNGIQIISMSLGSDYDMSNTVGQACEAAYNAGLLVVAAAGNDGFSRWLLDTVDYPARYDSVIAVGATDQYDTRAIFYRWYGSSTGPDVELAAPGVYIYSTYWNDTYRTLSGTSMACPMVTGTAALVWRAYPSYTNTQVRQRLQDTAEDLGTAGRDWEFGFGLVDAEAAATSPVLNNPPTAAPNGPYAGTEDEVITFYASASSDPDDDPLTYKWDFGDGATVTVTTPITTHTYTTGKAGEEKLYSITLIVNDGKVDSASAATTANVTGVNDAPVADANGPYSGVVGKSITFDASGSYDEEGIASYNWDFGDGETTTVNTATTTHTYTAPGTYNVTLTVTDIDGATSIAITTAQVNEVIVNVKRVKSLEMNLVQWRGRIAYAMATVTVVDATDNPVGYATVFGHWEVIDRDYWDSGITDASGKVTLRSPAVWRPVSGTTFTFVIESVTKDGWTYDPSANGDFDGDGIPGDIANSITVP